MDTVRLLFPYDKQSSVISHIKQQFNHLETLLEGISLLGEITKRSSDKIVSYGELLSAYLISEFFISEGLDAALQGY